MTNATTRPAPIDFRLDGKVVVVTECQPDDAMDIAVSLARAGATLAVTAPDVAELDSLLRQLAEEGYAAKPYRLDFRDLPSIRSAIDDVAADHGRIDVLVNNVGYNVPSLGLDVTESDWAEIQQINATGPFFAAQSAGRHMTKAGRGSIINIGTHTAVKANIRRAAYGAARAAMAQYTRNLALEWAPLGVRVNSVAPAIIKAHNLSAHPEMYRAMRERNPMGRFATEQEVAATIQFLASDASSFITGQVISVDGGSGL